MELELTGFAKITHHQGAIVCSYETMLTLPLDQAQNALTGLMEQLQQFVDAQGGIIGHIKAHIQEQGRAVSLSTTGDGVHATDSSATETQVRFVAIVFAVEERRLQTLVEELFAELEDGPA